MILTRKVIDVEEVDIDNSEAITRVFDYIFPDEYGSCTMNEWNDEDKTSLQVLIVELDERLWSDGDMDLPDIPCIGIPGFNVDIATNRCK